MRSHSSSAGTGKSQVRLESKAAGTPTNVPPRPPRCVGFGRTRLEAPRTHWLRSASPMTDRHPGAATAPRSHDEPAVRWFRVVAVIEAISYLVLVGASIAKRLPDGIDLVPVLGPIHG